MKVKSFLIVLVLTLVAFVLRVYRLDFFSLRGDEAFTVIFVQRTWEGLWRGISTIEPNPPLMYLALRVWVALAGASEFVTRYFSVFFGVACVPLLYRLAREIFASRMIALCAAALIAINPYQIWHAQDVRNYTMWPALSLLGLIFFWRWWSAERKQMTDDRRQTLRIEILDLGFFTLATLASLYTHYYDVFILVALNLFVFTFATLDRRWKTLARWVGAQMVLVALYAPWVLFGTNRITTYGEASAEQSVSLIEQLARTIAAFTLGDTMPGGIQIVVVGAADARARRDIDFPRAAESSTRGVHLFVARDSIFVPLGDFDRAPLVPRTLFEWRCAGILSRVCVWHCRGVASYKIARGKRVVFYRRFRACARELFFQSRIRQSAGLARAGAIHRRAATTRRCHRSKFQRDGTAVLSHGRYQSADDSARVFRHAG